MAAYTVRIGGKEHGPFTGAQLKALADKGQVTEDAEVRLGDDGRWYPATKVKGLFSSSPKKSEGRKSATGESGTIKSGVRKKSRPKATVVDAADVFDLDEDDEEDDVDDEYEDEYVDDFDEQPRRPRRGRPRKPSGPSWGQVRLGLLLLSIVVCMYAGAFAMQALSELITGLMMGSGKPLGRSTANLLSLLIKGSVFVAFLANITAVVGAAMSVFAPNRNGAKGLAIALLSTMSIHVITHFIYVFQPVIDAGGRYGGLGTLDSLFSGFRSAGDVEVAFFLTWVPYFGGLIVFSVLLWALSEQKREYRNSHDCLMNIWMIGIYVGVIFLGYLIIKLELYSGGGRGSGRAIIWVMILVRMGHLSLLGVYLGRLISQSFYTRSLL